jgi:hypothetical protein
MRQVVIVSVVWGARIELMIVVSRGADPE